jgi:hypothetical protein
MIKAVLTTDKIPCNNPDCNLLFTPARAGQDYCAPECRASYWEKIRKHQAALIRLYRGRHNAESLSYAQGGQSPAMSHIWIESMVFMLITVNVITLGLMISEWIERG